jgi:hypothetical protein
MELAGFGNLQCAGDDAPGKLDAKIGQAYLVAGALRKFRLQPVFESRGLERKDQRETDDEPRQKQKNQQLETGARENGHRKKDTR